MFEIADNAGFIQGVKVADGAPTMSHLFLADDSLIFGNAGINEILQLSNVCFFMRMRQRQRINFQKFVIAFGPGVEEDQKAGRFIANFECACCSIS